MSDLTIVEYWAPWCRHCQAMEPLLREVSEDFPQVEVRRVDVTDAKVAYATDGLKGTPTLIGYRGESEVLRYPGRRSRAELVSIFEELVLGQRSAIGLGDLKVRASAGVGLMVVGLATGPTWLLLVMGVIVVVGSFALWLRT